MRGEPQEEERRPTLSQLFLKQLAKEAMDQDQINSLLTRMSALQDAQEAVGNSESVLGGLNRIKELIDATWTEICSI